MWEQHNQNSTPKQSSIYLKLSAETIPVSSQPDQTEKQPRYLGAYTFSYINDGNLRLCVSETTYVSVSSEKGDETGQEKEVSLSGYGSIGSLLIVIMPKTANNISNKISRRVLLNQ